jgi:hypothetical protein
MCFSGAKKWCGALSQSFHEIELACSEDLCSQRVSDFQTSLPPKLMNRFAVALYGNDKGYFPQGKKLNVRRTFTDKKATHVKQ